MNRKHFDDVRSTKPKHSFTKRKFFFIFIAGFLIIVVMKKIVLETFTVDVLPKRALSLLVKDIYDTGRKLTLKTTCFLCEEKDHGRKWREINEDKACQDVMFENCFKNYTHERRRTTKVAALFRRCDLMDCACDNIHEQTQDWCVVPNCPTHLICCEERYLTCSKTYNSFFHKYFK